MRWLYRVLSQHRDSLSRRLVDTAHGTSHPVPTDSVLARYLLLVAGYAGCGTSRLLIPRRYHLLPNFKRPLLVTDVARKHGYGYTGEVRDFSYVPGHAEFRHQVKR